MYATYEFRVNDDYADRLFRPDEGKDLTSVRVIHISPEDPRFLRIGEIDREIDRETHGRAYFFAGWDIRYKYTPREILTAEAFMLHVKSAFEPAGEDCGTEYDESVACPYCGAGAKQVSDLRLDLRKAPRSKDIARTIADEVIVSQRFAELLIDSGLTGFELRRVRHKARYEDDPLDLKLVPSGRELLQRAEAAGAPHPSGIFWVWLNRVENIALLDQAEAEYAAMRRQRSRRKGKRAPVWYQLIVTSARVDIVPPTRVGVNPFDEDAKGEHRCSRGDTIGLNMLSELSISRQQFQDTGADIAASRQYVGTRRGVLRPRQLLVVSPRFRQLVENNRLKGFRFEIAYLR